MNTDISIRKPYEHLEDRIITFNNIEIHLDKYELTALFEQLDCELYNCDTRDNLLAKIDDLEEENNILLNENLELEDRLSELEEEND